MNKIKQTEQNLQYIRTQLKKEESNYVNLSTEELLKQTSLILKPKQQKNPIFVAAKMQIKQELEERQKYYDDRRNQLKQLLESENNNTQYINFNLLNSLIPNIYFNYLERSSRVILSTNNKINFQRRQSRKASQLQVTKINGQFLDEYQQQIYKIFNTREQIHFIFKNEMDLNIRVIPCRIKQVFREDKNTYEVILMENQLEEEQNELPNVEQRELSVQNFRFQFLNRIQYWNLYHNTNVPSVLVRQYNLYLILREVILDALDYMHLKTIDILQDEILENELPSFKTHTSTEQSTDNRMKQIEKKVKAQALKLRRQKRPRKSTSIDHLLYLQSDQLKDYRVSPIPHNQGYQAQRAVKDYLKETTQTNLPACSKLGKGGMDKVQKGEYFLKQKGKKDEYHICWLEQRGFHLVWYHLKTDKTARGIGQLDDTLIRDEGKIYQVKLLDRFLTIKLDKPLVGQIWRKSIANQIAYKTYLNNLWFNCRLFDNSPKVSLVDYYFNENTNTLDLSDNALNLKGLSNVLPLCYITKVTQIFIDSIMNHKIYHLNLQNSHLGPVAIVQLLQYFQHNKHRIKVLDISNCALTMQPIKELAQFLLNQNSFSLNQIYLNDNPGIGDEGIALLSEAIQQRYDRFWDTSTQEMPPSPGYRRHPRQKTSARENSMDLELLIVLNFKNIGARDFSKLFDAIAVMIKHSLDLPAVDIDLMRQQTLSRVIKKLKNKQYNRRNLQLIKEFYADEIDPILEIIKMQLDISNNQLNSLQQLGELISQYDCFRSLHLRQIGLGIQDLLEFSKRVVNSISLELLEMTCTSQGDIQFILDSLSENTSLKTIILECQSGELQSGYSFQYFIADVQEL